MFKIGEKSMFINLSNHFSDKWSKKQIEAARIYGEIINLPFPQVNPQSTSEDMDKLADNYYDRITYFNDPVVMLQGEFIFTFRVTVKLKEAGIKVLAGRSERKVIESVNGEGLVERKSVFEFVGFMEY